MVFKTDMERLSSRISNILGGVFHEYASGNLSEEEEKEYEADLRKALDSLEKWGKYSFKG